MTIFSLFIESYVKSDEIITRLYSSLDEDSIDVTGLGTSVNAIEQLLTLSWLII